MGWKQSHSEWAQKVCFLSKLERLTQRILNNGTTIGVSRQLALWQRRRERPRQKLLIKMNSFWCSAYAHITKTNNLNEWCAAVRITIFSLELFNYSYSFVCWSRCSISILSFCLVCGDNDSVGDGGDGTLALFAVTFNLTRTLHGIHPYLAASGVEW